MANTYRAILPTFRQSGNKQNQMFRCLPFFGAHRRIPQQCRDTRKQSQQKGGYGGPTIFYAAMHTRMTIDFSSTDVVSLPQQHTSRYQIIEYDDGFRVEGRERAPVEVRLSYNKTRLFILDGDDPTQLLDSLNMYAYPVIRDTIIDTLMQRWTSPPDSHYWPGAYEWAKQQVRKRLQQRLHAQWQRLLSLVP